MANSWAPFGLRSFGHRDGSAPTMGLQRFFMNSSDTVAVGTGDLVVQSTAASAAGYVTGISTSATSPPTAGYVGVFAGCEYYNPSVGRTLWNSYWPGSVSATSAAGPVTAYVITDTEMQFIAQGSTTNVLGSSNVGMNIGWLSSLANNPNTTTGISQAGLASSGITASASYAFRVVDIYQNFAPPGVNGTSTTEGGQILVVVPNTWARNTLTGVST